jgi:hypothetical protein
MPKNDENLQKMYSRAADRESHALAKALHRTSKFFLNFLRADVWKPLLIMLVLAFSLQVVTRVT